VWAAGALAGLALSVPAAAAGTKAQPAPPPEPPALSAEATRVADWVASSEDNGKLPYIIVDKQSASLFLFDAKGKVLGQAPVLIGVAEGDEATPGIGAKSLSEIGPAERTTPAGRFIAKFGRAVGKQQVLWVDYSTSVALHAVVTTNKKERRRERLLSPTADDNRITFGCINVPATFYSKSIRPLFLKSGGVVYVLPDSKRLEDVFPRLWVQPFLDKQPLATPREGDQTDTSSSV
jgi:hypothetical protein